MQETEIKPTIPFEESISLLGEYLKIVGYTLTKAEDSLRPKIMGYHISRAPMKLTPAKSGLAKLIDKLVSSKTEKIPPNSIASETVGYVENNSSHNKNYPIALVLYENLDSGASSPEGDYDLWTLRAAAEKFEEKTKVGVNVTCVHWIVGE